MPSSACANTISSEEHTSELQSHDNLVCRLLLEKTSHAGPAGPAGPDGPAGPCLFVLCASARHPGERPSTSLQTFCFFFLKSWATPYISSFPQPPPLPI